MKKNSTVSRRQFVTLGCLGAAGFWTLHSNQSGARFLRGAVAETGRKVASPRFNPKPQQWNDNAITASWLGHSSVLINFFGVHILTDPVLFKRVGANFGLGTFGPKRLVAPALTAEQLPPIDLVLLSHAHMDHFDVPTLKCLPATTHAVTAKSTGDLLADTRLKKVTELSWGQTIAVPTRHGKVEVEAFEVKHWGARWRSDTQRGYNGYVLAREGKKIIFGGDTAWSDSFKALRGKGPFEMAIMPIGAYQPWICSHCTPEESVRMANEAGAKYFLPIHHKTFALGREGQHEPLRRLEGALEKERIALREIGETFSAV